MNNKPTTPTTCNLTHSEYKWILYKVIQGETLTSLAQQYGVCINILAHHIRATSEKERVVVKYYNAPLHYAVQGNKRRNSKGYIPVHQYTKGGRFIRSYPSVTHAVKANTGVSTGGISKVLSGKSKSCGGYKWQKDVNF
jgi:hypothetical protein